MAVANCWWNNFWNPVGTIDDSYDSEFDPAF